MIKAQGSGLAGSQLASGILNAATNLGQKVWLSCGSMHPKLWATKDYIPDGYTEAMGSTPGVESSISEVFFTHGW